jgi:AcrR family transcriptional regulator
VTNNPSRDEPDTKAARTRQRVVRAAAHELATHGYGGTSLRAIANAADLQLGSLYFHFESKDALVAEAMAEGIDFALGWVERDLERLGELASPEERLRVAMVAHVAALHDSRDRAAAVLLMADTLPTGLRQAQASHERRYGRIWLELIGAAQDSGAISAEADPRTLRQIVLGSLNSTLSAPRSSPQDRVELTEALMRLLLS